MQIKTISNFAHLPLLALIAFWISVIMLPFIRVAPFNGYRKRNSKLRSEFCYQAVQVQTRGSLSVIDVGSVTYDIWYGMICMISYDMIYDMACCDMIYDMMWYDMMIYIIYDICDMMIYDIRYDIWYDVIWYDMIYDTMRYDTIWYMWYDDIWYTIWYDIYDVIYDVMWYDMMRYDKIWYDMWYDMIYDTRYDIYIYWYDMMRYDTMWYMIWYIWYDIWYKMWYDMIYLLTAVGLTPWGSITVHIYTQTVHRTTQLTTLFGRLSGIRSHSGQSNWEECWPCPVFASYTLAFALQLRKKHGKPSVRVAEECKLARWKQNIQNRTYITVIIHKHNNKIHNLQN